MIPSRYNVLTESFDGERVLGFNCLTGAYFAVRAEDSSRLRPLVQAAPMDPDDSLHAWLAANGFLADPALAEAGVVHDRYRHAKNNVSGLSLTLAPTINCNFRCTYCFQEHPSDRMSEADLESIVRLVDERLEADSHLHITWFGGEPLLAFSLITFLQTAFDEICQARGCSFSETMITNGSLLDRAKAELLGSRPDFRYVQITLDGTADVHDARRVLAGGKPTWDRIVENLAVAAPLVPITIRVNVDRTNVADLPRLVDRLVEAKLLPGVTIYLGHTLPYTEVCEDVGDQALSIEEFARVETLFGFYLIQRGLLQPVGVPRPKTGVTCIADNPQGLVIAPGGVLHKCWNEVAQRTDSSVGHLPSGGGRSVSLPVLSSQNGAAERLNTWEQYDPFVHAMCRECRVKPLCRGGCPWEARKMAEEDTGACSSLKFNIADRLRLHDLQRVIKLGVEEMAGEPALEPEPCE